MYIIYLLTRNDNLKYIGMTNNFDRRLYEHKKSDRFETGLKSYSIIEECDSIETAQEREKYWITYYNSYNKGLNLTPHGGGNHQNTITFNTYGMTFTKNKKWYNNGNTNIRCYEGSEPDGFIKGKLTWTSEPRHLDKKARKNMSLGQRGRSDDSFSSKLNEDQVLELLKLLKEKPPLTHVNESRDITKSTKTTYIRRFCQEYCDYFGVKDFYLFMFIKEEGGKKWNHLWKRFFNAPLYQKINTKPKGLTKDQVTELFTMYNTLKSCNTKTEVANIFSEKHNLTSGIAYKMLTKKGGKKWNSLYNEIVDTTYIRHEPKTEYQIYKYFSDFIKSNKNKKEFYLGAEQYGMSPATGKNLLYNKDKGKWQYIWERALNEN